VTDPDWTGRVKIRIQGKTKSYLASDLLKLDPVVLEDEQMTARVDKSKQRQIPVIVFLFGGGEFSLKTLEVAMKMGFSAIVVKGTGRVSDLLHAWITDAKKEEMGNNGQKLHHSHHRWDDTSSEESESGSDEESSYSEDDDDGGAASRRPSRRDNLKPKRRRATQLKGLLWNHGKDHMQKIRELSTSEFRRVRHSRTRRRWALVRYQLLEPMRRQRWIETHLSPVPEIVVDQLQRDHHRDHHLSPMQNERIVSGKSTRRLRWKKTSSFSRRKAESETDPEDMYKHDDEDEHARKMVPKLPLKLQRLEALYTNPNGDFGDKEISKCYQAERTLMWMCGRCLTGRNRCFFFDLHDDGSPQGKKGGGANQNLGADTRRGKENENQLMKQVQGCLTNNPTLDDDSELWLAVKWDSAKAVVQKLESRMKAADDLIGELLVYTSFHDLGTIYSYLMDEGLDAAHLDPLVHRDICEITTRDNDFNEILQHFRDGTMHGVGSIVGALKGNWTGDGGSDGEQSDLNRASSYANKLPACRKGSISGTNTIEAARKSLRERHNSDMLRSENEDSRSTQKRGSKRMLAFAQAARAVARMKNAQQQHAKNKKWAHHAKLFERRTKYGRTSDNSLILWSELDSVERELLREHHGRGGECGPSCEEDEDETTRTSEALAEQRERLLYFRRNNGVKEGWQQIHARFARPDGSDGDEKEEEDSGQSAARPFRKAGTRKFSRSTMSMSDYPHNPPAWAQIRMKEGDMAALKRREKLQKLLCFQPEDRTKFLTLKVTPKLKNAMKKVFYTDSSKKLAKLSEIHRLFWAVITDRPHVAIVLWKVMKSPLAGALLAKYAYTELVKANPLRRVELEAHADEFAGLSTRILDASSPHDLAVQLLRTQNPDFGTEWWKTAKDWREMLNKRQLSQKELLADSIVMGGGTGGDRRAEAELQEGDRGDSAQARQQALAETTMRLEDHGSVRRISVRRVGGALLRRNGSPGLRLGSRSQRLQQHEIDHWQKANQSKPIWYLFAGYSDSDPTIIDLALSTCCLDTLSHPHVQSFLTDVFEQSQCPAWLELPWILRQVFPSTPVRSYYYRVVVWLTFMVLYICLLLIILLGDAYTDDRDKSPGPSDPGYLISTLEIVFWIFVSSIVSDEIAQVLDIGSLRGYLKQAGNGQDMVLNSFFVVSFVFRFVPYINYDPDGAEDEDRTIEGLRSFSFLMLYANFPIIMFRFVEMVQLRMRSLGVLHIVFKRMLWDDLITWSVYTFFAITTGAVIFFNFFLFHRRSQEESQEDEDGLIVSQFKMLFVYGDPGQVPIDHNQDNLKNKVRKYI
jgi:hypothetical protein